MKYRKLGNSGLLTSEFALGTMIFGEESSRSTSPDEAKRMIDYFVDIGGNHIDTANVYAGGRSEEIVGQAIKGKRDRVILATKVRFPMGKGPNEVGLSRYHIIRSAESSLRRLQTDVIDLFSLHGWDPLTPLEESLRTLDDLVTAGKVRYVGVSNFKAWQMMKALGISDAYKWVRFVAAQFQYSLVARDIENEFVDLCESEGVGITPWGPLGGGFLSGKYRFNKRPTIAEEGRLATTPDEWEESWARRATEQNWKILAVVEEIVAAHASSTFSQVALAWLLTRPAVVSVVIGARTIDQLEDNIKAGDLHLTNGEVSRLNEISSPLEGYPYRNIRTAPR